VSFKPKTKCFHENPATPEVEWSENEEGEMATEILQRSHVRRKSGTSCAVACHAESERLLLPLGRRGKKKKRLNRSQPPIR
jgi:hypothetical protein